MRRGRLELRPIDPTLVGGKHTDYASFISLFAPAFPDAGELISLGNRYTVSRGAHSTHTTLLMDKHGSVPLGADDFHSKFSIGRCNRRFVGHFVSPHSGPKTYHTRSTLGGDLGSP
jgi:hypothetical protein